MAKDLRNGTPWRQIVSLALPLLFGNIFQAFYNMADTVIVGRLIGAEALAGVGAASPIFNLLCALLIGISVGASILVSQLYGADERDKLPVASSTIILLTIILSLLLTMFGEVFAVPLLRLLHTPEEILPYASAYLRTVLIGTVCSAFYNQFTGMLRGLGDTRTPLYILIFSVCLNLCLDIVSVCVFRAGVIGVALATVIAEGCAAIAAYVYIIKKVPMLIPGSWRTDRGMIRLLVHFGIPMGLQQSSISFGHVLMQAVINPFGTALIAGYAAAAKVDMFAVMPIISLGMAASAFCAQNAGAGDYVRVKKAWRDTICITLVLCVVLAFLVTPLRAFWTGLFLAGDTEPALKADILAAGCGMLAVTPVFYWVLGSIHVTLNTMAGAGDTMCSMIAMIGMMLLRVLLAWLFVGAGLGANGIWWSFPMSWAIALIGVLIHFAGGNWKKKGLKKRDR